MIIFELTLEDFIVFNEHFYKTNLNLFQKNSRWIILLGFSIYVFSSSYHSFTENVLNWGNWVILLLIFGMLLLPALFQKSIRKRNAKTFVKNNPQYVGSREIDFDDEKLIIKQEKSSSEYEFSAFIKLEETSDYLFAYFSKQNALILPKRISDKEGLNVLIERIKKSISKQRI